MDKGWRVAGEVSHCSDMIGKVIKQWKIPIRDALPKLSLQAPASVSLTQVRKFRLLGNCSPIARPNDPAGGKLSALANDGR